MIFVSLGTNKWPFERLVRTVDELAPELDQDVFIQAGATLDAYTPENADYADIIPREKYDRLVNECDIFVSHAGTGSIITGIKAETPTVLFPRESDRGESNYDLIETARGWADVQGIEVATSTDELESILRAGDLEPLSYDGPDEHLEETVADILDRVAGDRPADELTVFCPTPPGGHLLQMLQLEETLARHDVHFLTWDEQVAGSIDGVDLVRGFHTEEFPDLGLFRDFAVSNAQIVRRVLRHRPDVVVSTGGGGFVCVTAYLAKLVGADIVHIESRTRFENTSTTGEILYPLADHFFAQHPDVADEHGEKARFEGTLI